MGRLPMAICYTRSELNVNIQSFKQEQIYNFFEEKPDPESFNFEAESWRCIGFNDKSHEKEGIYISFLGN